MDVVEELELDKEVLKRIEMIYKFTGVKDIIKQVSMNNYVVIIIYIWKKLYSLNTKWRQFSKHICIKRINIRAKLSVSV